MELGKLTWRQLSILPLLFAALVLMAACSGTQQEELSEVSFQPASNVIAVQESDDDERSQTIQIIGIVETLSNTSLVVNGLTVDISSAAADGTVEAGSTVQIQGRQGAGIAIDAQYVWVLQPPAPTPAPSAGGPIPFVIEGPVQAISGNRVRVHGYDLDLDDDARLRGIQVGDVLRIAGNVDGDRLDDLFDDGIDDDIDDDRFVAVRDTQIGFLSNEIYASDDGQVWRDSGMCADAPPGWAAARAWRSRCSGEFGGGLPATGASTSGTSGTEASISGTEASISGGDGSSSSGSFPVVPPPPAGGDDNSSSSSSSVPAPPPPPPPPPAGGDGDSSSGSGSGSGSG